MYENFRQYIESRTHLTEAEHARMAALWFPKKLRRKQYLLQEGDLWKYHAFITKGLLRTYSVNDKGVEHILQFTAENWWTGDRESLLSGAPSRFNIDAIEDTEVLLITPVNFDLLCKEIPAFNDMIQTILSKSFVVAQNRIHASISLTAEDKYKNFLDKYPTFANRVPQHMIASFLGITPETLSRIRRQS